MKVGYERDLNQDQHFRIKLKHELDVYIANIIIDELNFIRKILQELVGIDSTSDGYGLAFEVFAIAVLHQYSYEDVINKYIIHGSYDGKIDAIVWDLDEIYIYQIKTGMAVEGSINNMRKQLQTFMNGCPLEDNARDLQSFLQRNKDQIIGKKLSFRIISTNSKSKYNITPNTIYQKFLEQLFLPISENKIELIINFPIDEEGNISYSKTPYQDYVFFIQANRLKDALFQYNRRSNNDLSLYFCDNVRGVLKENQEMQDTILYEPENFCKYNNGISITGSVTNLGHALKIVNPVINNGQQTIYNLIRADQNLDQIYLMLSVKNSSLPNIKSKISRYTNDQVKVKIIDILSLNPYIRNLQKKIFEQFLNNSNINDRYFLDIYSQGTKFYQSKLSTICSRNHIIDLLDFLKLYFSIQDNSKLGYWKSTPSSQLENVYSNIDEDFDFNLANRVCNTIIQVEDYLDQVDDKKKKADLCCANLAIEYLICKYDLELTQALSIIEEINDNYYKNPSEVSKLIDIYKSPNIAIKLDQCVNKQVLTYA